MSQTVSTITLPLPLGMGTVNSYLLQSGDGYILIDTGAPNSRRILRRELENLAANRAL